MLLKVIEASPLDFRQEIAAKLVISGGTSMAQYFDETLLSKAGAMLPLYPLKSIKCKKKFANLHGA